MPSNNYYQYQVDAFIPTARKEAREKVSRLGYQYKTVRGKDGADYQFCMESLFFHQAMNRLTREVGLRDIGTR